MPVNKIVIHDKNGKILKGTTADFLPKKPMFHLVIGGLHGDEVKEILIDTLKAVFFVKSYTGDKSYNDLKGFAESPGAVKKVKAVFNDGEIIFGYTNVINFDQLGLSIVPADPKSNNERIFMVFSSLSALEIEGSPIDLQKIRK